MSPRISSLDVGPFLGEITARSFHDLARQAVGPRDIEGPTLARHAHQDAVGRRKTLPVEIHGSVEATETGVTVVFEDAVVRREHGETAAFDEPVEKAHRDCAAFFGIGARSEFVEQDEASRTRSPRDLPDDAHVARKRGEGLIYGLLVAYVRVYRIENGKGRLRRGRHAETELIHQGEKADGLEGDRLSSRIGSRDDECPRVPGEVHVDGHGIPAEEGMPRPPEHESFGDVPRQDEAAELRVPGPSIDPVESPHGPAGESQRLEPLMQFFGRFPEYPQQLLPIARLFLNELVVFLDELFGLQKNRLSRRRNLVHDSAYPRFEVRPQGQHRAAVPDRRLVGLEHSPYFWIPIERVRKSGDVAMDPGYTLAGGSDLGQVAERSVPVEDCERDARYGRRVRHRGEKLRNLRRSRLSHERCEDGE